MQFEPECQCSFEAFIKTCSYKSTNYNARHE